MQKNLNEYTVLINWDNEAQVWYCTSEDIPGLILESGSLDVLVERARHAAPEILELMGHEEAAYSARDRSGINAAYSPCLL